MNHVGSTVSDTNGHVAQHGGQLIYILVACALFYMMSPSSELISFSLLLLSRVCETLGAVRRDFGWPHCDYVGCVITCKITRDLVQPGEKKERCATTLGVCAAVRASGVLSRAGAFGVAHCIPL